MKIEEEICASVISAVKQLYGQDVPAKMVSLQKTKREFEGNIVPTQEMRQEATDDHGMHIYGIAKDQNGKEYYMVKNSWGKYGDYKGTWYMTKTYVAYKTMDFMVNKNAVPKDLRKKLGL